jgi:putative transposase
MPRKPRSSTSEAPPLAPIPSEILDQFVRQGPLTAEELDAAVRRFKKAIIERALGAELSHHLGYVPGGTKPEDTTNHRNGRSGKTVLTDDGTLTLAVPRDREGSFEPRLIGTHERRFTGSTTRWWRSMRAASSCARFKRFSPTCTASTCRPI